MAAHPFWLEGIELFYLYSLQLKKNDTWGDAHQIEK